MGTVLPPNAKTAPRVQKEIQESKGSAPVLAKRYNVNIKTMYRWRKALAEWPSKGEKRQNVVRETKPFRGFRAVLSSEKGAQGRYALFPLGEAGKLLTATMDSMGYL